MIYVCLYDTAYNVVSCKQPQLENGISINIRISIRWLYILCLITEINILLPIAFKWRTFFKTTLFQASLILSSTLCCAKLVLLLPFFLPPFFFYCTYLFILACVLRFKLKDENDQNKIKQLYDFFKIIKYFYIFK